LIAEAPVTLYRNITNTPTVLITGVFTSNTGNGSGVSQGFSKVNDASFYATVGYATGSSISNTATNLASRIRASPPMVNGVYTPDADFLINGNRYVGCTPYTQITTSNGNTGAIDMYPFNIPINAMWQRDLQPYVYPVTIYFSVWLQSTKDIPSADLNFNLTAIQVS
jgi:hypothetical protein